MSTLACCSTSRVSRASTYRVLRPTVDQDWYARFSRISEQTDAHEWTIVRLLYTVISIEILADAPVPGLHPFEVQTWFYTNSKPVFPEIVGTSLLRVD